MTDPRIIIVNRMDPQSFIAMMKLIKKEIKRDQVEGKELRSFYSYWAVAEDQIFDSYVEAEPIDRGGHRAPDGGLDAQSMRSCAAPVGGEVLL